MLSLRSVAVTAAVFVGAVLAACQSKPSSEKEAEAAAWGYSGEPTNVFLSVHGVGDRDESLAYETLVLRGANPLTFTLDKWRSQFIGTAPVYTALYRNTSELGFWRQMTCTQHVDRGVGGCMVSNWGSPDEPSSGVPNKGTVAMNLSPEGFVRFYVFLPDGKLSPSAVLDSEGPKFMPRLCTVCHSGAKPNPSTSEDLGSVFREFETSLLEKRPGITQVQAEQEWFHLNRVVQEANLAIRSESEGSPYGTDHAKQAINDRIDALYIPGGEPDGVPASWAKVDAETQNLWKKVIVPYCVACHRHNLDDWTQFSEFEYFRKDSGLRNYLPNAPDPNAKVPAMPQAALQFAHLQDDKAALEAITNWLGDAGPAPGSVCTTPHEVYTRRCGTCGKSEAYCLPDGDVDHVTTYGACFGEVAGGCSPGAIEDIPCGTCGRQTRRCNTACEFVVSDCRPGPADPCTPGAIDFTSDGCPAGQVRQRVCDAFCTYSPFNASCTPEVGGPVGVIARTSAMNSTIVELTSSQVQARLVPGTSCPSAGIGTKQTPYAYVEVKNPSDKTVRVSIFNSAVPGAIAIDTILAAYSGSAAPATDAARKACVSGVADVGTVALTGDAQFASLDGDNAVTLAPSSSVMVYVASLVPFSVIQDGDHPLASTRVRLDVKTEDVR